MDRITQAVTEILSSEDQGFPAKHNSGDRRFLAAAGSPKIKTCSHGDIDKHFFFHDGKQVRCRGPE